MANQYAYLISNSGKKYKVDIDILTEKSKYFNQALDLNPNLVQFQLNYNDQVVILLTSYLEYNLIPKDLDQQLLLLDITKDLGILQYEIELTNILSNNILIPLQYYPTSNGSHDQFLRDFISNVDLDLYLKQVQNNAIKVADLVIINNDAYQILSTRLFNSGAYFESQFSEFPVSTLNKLYGRYPYFNTDFNRTLLNSLIQILFRYLENRENLENEKIEENEENLSEIIELISYPMLLDLNYSLLSLNDAKLIKLILLDINNKFLQTYPAFLHKYNIEILPIYKNYSEAQLILNFISDYFISDYSILILPIYEIIIESKNL